MHATFVGICVKKERFNITTTRCKEHGTAASGAPQAQQQPLPPRAVVKIHNQRRGAEMPITPATCIMFLGCLMTYVFTCAYAQRREREREMCVYIIVYV